MFIRRLTQKNVRLPLTPAMRPIRRSFTHMPPHNHSNRSNALHQQSSRTFFDKIPRPTGLPSQETIKAIIGNTSRLDMATANIRFRAYLATMIKQDFPRHKLTPFSENYTGPLMRAVVPHQRNVIIHPKRPTFASYTDTGCFNAPALWTNYLQATFGYPKTFQLWLIADTIQRQRFQFFNFIMWYFLFSGISGLYSEYQELRHPTLATFAQSTLLDMQFNSAWQLVQSPSNFSKQARPDSSPLTNWSFIRTLGVTRGFNERINRADRYAQSYLQDLSKHYNALINSLLFMYHGTNITESTRALLLDESKKQSESLTAFISQGILQESRFGLNTIPSFSIPELIHTNQRNVQTILSNQNQYVNVDSYSYYLLQLALSLIFMRRNIDTLHTWALAHGTTPVACPEEINDDLYKTFIPGNPENQQKIFQKIVNFHAATPLKDITSYPSTDVQIALQNNITYPLLTLPMLAQACNTRSVNSHLLPPQMPSPSPPSLPTTDQITAQNTLIPSQLLTRYTVTSDLTVRQSANILLLTDLCLCQIIGEFNRIHNQDNNNNNNVAHTNNHDDIIHNAQQSNDIFAAPSTPIGHMPYDHSTTTPQPSTTIPFPVDTETTAVGGYTDLYAPLPLSVAPDQQNQY